jgi:ABC-type phosphate/phosphonate transport system substrate-binding protein
LIANARMYAATPRVKAAWNALLSWVLRRAGLDWEIVDYDAPAPLSALWARADLGCAMMCGLPYSRRVPRPLLVAAPVPSPARYRGKPVYWTDIVVRADAPFRTLEDTFGHVVGWTLPDSMSGCVALRAHLLQYCRGSGAKLYREAIGGFVNARQVIEGLAQRRIDVGPIDSYYHDLLRAADPQFAAQVRTVACTARAPIPPLVATAALAPDVLDALRAAFADAGGAAELVVERATLLLAGFVAPQQADYAMFEGVADASRRFPEIWSSKEMP